LPAATSIYSLLKLAHCVIKQYSKPKDISSSMQREMNYQCEEAKQLKKELLKVTQERDLLKKATAYFAREFK
jgi:transposase